MTKSFVDFFAGIGLVEYALSTNNWIHRQSLDYSPLKAKVYKHHFSLIENTNATGDPANVIEQIAHGVEEAEINELNEDFFGEDREFERYRVVDIFDVHGHEVPTAFLAHASFPCTDVSAAGGRAGIQTGEESSAIDSFLRVIFEMQDRRPAIIMLENVKGLISSQKGNDLRFLVQHLNRLGYLVDLLTIDAKHFVPQSRERVFLIGHYQKYPVAERLTEVEIQELRVSDVRGEAAVNFIKSNPLLGWTTWQLPRLPPINNDLQEAIDEDNEQWWSQSRTDYLKSQMFLRHAEWIDQHLYSRVYHYGTVFRRMRKRDDRMQSTAELRTDGIAGCLRTSKGGSAKQILVRVGRGEFKARLLSPRECAHLMGANDFRITDTVSETDALSCFGDAVCADVISWLDMHYLTPAYEAYRSIEAHEYRGRQEYLEEYRVAEMNADRLDETVRVHAKTGFEAWCLRNQNDKYGLPWRGRLYGALIVLSNLEKGNWSYLELHEATSTDEGDFFSKRSIRNHTRHRVALIFSEHSREDLRPSGAHGEAGRTSTASKQAGLGFIKLIRESLDKVPIEQRKAQGMALTEFLYQKVFQLLEEYQKLGGIEVSYSSAETISEYLTKLIDAHEGNPGAVLQHLVGAKLELRFDGTDIKIDHHSSSTADKQTGRLGDFEVGSTVFHVTKKAHDDHYRKAILNAQSGRTTYLLVPSKLYGATLAYGEEIVDGLARKVNVYTIEQFLGQNLDEMAKFDRLGALMKLQELLTLYNKLVGEYENDPSLRVVIPDFGL